MELEHPRRLCRHKLADERRDGEKSVYENIYRDADITTWRRHFSAAEYTVSAMNLDPTLPQEHLVLILRSGSYDVYRKNVAEKAEG